MHLRGTSRAQRIRMQNILPHFGKCCRNLPVSSRRRVGDTNPAKRNHLDVYTYHHRFIFYLAPLLHTRHAVAHLRTNYLNYSLLRANPAKAGDAEFRG